MRTAAATAEKSIQRTKEPRQNDEYDEHAFAFGIEYNRAILIQFFFVNIGK